MPYFYTTSFKKRSTITPNTNVADIENIISTHNDKTKLSRYETQTSVSDTPWTKSSKKLNEAIPKILRVLKEYNLRFKPEQKKDYFYFFEIPKSSGGTRKISAPNEELKTYYTWTRDRIREDMMVLAHNNAYAYIQRRSIVDALRTHQRNESEYFLKIDVSNFFDSCSQELIKTQLNKVYPFSLTPKLVDELAIFATLEDGLPQGTPLSPDLTNWLMIPFDAHFTEWCSKHGYIYTRYADDMIISHRKSFRFMDVIEQIEYLFTTHNYPFEIKKKKTRYGSKAGSNWNLGLMLNKDNQITVGHEYKKRIKTLIFKTFADELPQNDPHVLGLIAYLKQIEPGYYYSLNQFCIRKYRSDINEIMSTN